MEWTPSQQDAIDSTQGTVLVAAAAGSGKTAVLVQRAIGRLTHPQNPTPANKLLIVTFTKAAAAEMRARLERRLSSLLRQNPTDPLLRRQSILVHQAHIGTVDSFCGAMAREFFQLLNISPDFRILSDKREAELTAQALEEALTAAYDQGRIQALADAFTAERDDRRLGHMALSLYHFMQSHPFPEKWLEEKVQMYFAGDSGPWERVILEHVARAAAHCASLLENALSQAGEDSLYNQAFSSALSADRAACLGLAQAAGAGDRDAASALWRGFAPKRRGILRGVDKEDPLLLRLEACRKEVKRVMDSLGKCLPPCWEDAGAELQEAGPLLRSLADLTLDFARRYAKKKQDRNFLDYSDLEHCAIRLFCGEDGAPTPAAREVARRFDEIMIDEYQDINQVQDSIFRAVSQDERNLFMVGDVKQSIYGFRQAMPEIFLGCRARFSKFDRKRANYPGCIVLDRNFRSRPQVTDTVNYVFSLLMSKEAGDLDYTGEERLVCGADFSPKAGCETELAFLSRGDAPAEVAEAQFIARRIRAMVESGFTVSENGGERPAHWGDFCVLLRSANKHAHAYAQELKRLGVPARATVSGGFFAAAEVQMVLSLLRVIDNPNQDIPLLALLMSPLYGFSADEVARLRAGSRDVSVFVSLTRAGETDPRCAQVMADIRRMRQISAAMPADSLLTLLYGRTGCLELVQAMEDGPGRLLNLRLLHRYAQEYEGSGYHGLAGFVGFLDRLMAGGQDLQGAEVQAGSQNAVPIMSIHKSKGLQFPVCIVAGCGRNFAGDQTDDVLLHPELGLGVKLRDPGGTARYTTTAREAIALESARSAGAEELRVLYVALTRAQEKLILVSSAKDMTSPLNKAALEAVGSRPSAFTVQGAKNATHWLLACALRHPDGGVLRQAAGGADIPLCREDYTPWNITLEAYAPEEVRVQDPVLQAQEEDLALYQALKDQAAFVYPHEESVDVAAKVSASKLAAEQGGSRELNLSRPAWLGQQGMTPAQRGIALHEFMQFADFHAAAAAPAAELARLARGAFLSEEQADAVELPRVRAFFQSPLGRRVLASPQVVKERRFTAVLPAHMAQPGLSPGVEPVVLQGAVDCTFLEEGKLHIIDFKTDRVEDMEELWLRYHTQLRLYAYAMEEVTGTPVGEMFLYSTWLSQGSGRPYEREQEQLRLFDSGSI